MTLKRVLLGLSVAVGEAAIAVGTLAGHLSRFQLGCILIGCLATGVPAGIAYKPSSGTWPRLHWCAVRISDAAYKPFEMGATAFLALLLVLALGFCGWMIADYEGAMAGAINQCRAAGGEVVSVHTARRTVWGGGPSWCDLSSRNP
jgi:hypothetical protein